MKNRLKALFSLLLVLSIFADTSLALDRRQVLYTDREIHGLGDWNGDGRLDLIVIDRVLGTFRLGMQRVDQSLIWGPSQPTGIEFPGHLSVHRLVGLDRDEAVVCSSQANRVHLLQPAQGVSPTPILVTPQGIGPVAATAMDVLRPGNDAARADLIVHTVENNGSPRTHIEFLQSQVGGIVADGLPIPTTFWNLEHTARVKLLESGSEYYAGLQRPGGSSTFRVATLSAALPTEVTSLAMLPKLANYVQAPLRADLPDQNVFVFFERGASQLQLSVVDPAGLLTPVVVRSLAGSSGIVSVTPIRSSSDGYELFIVYNWGTEGGFFRLDSNNQLVAGDVVEMPTEGLLNGAVSFGTDAFALLTNTGNLGGISTVANVFKHDGSGWQDQGATVLPAVGGQVGLNNVLVYDREPLVNEDSVLLRSFQVPDWTSLLSIDSSGNVGVTRETYGGMTAGLTQPGAVTVGQMQPGLKFGMVNQPRPDVSISIDDRQLGEASPQVRITPPPGDYEVYVEPKLVIMGGYSPGAVRAYFRTSINAPWTEFDLEDPTEIITLPTNTLSLTRIWFYAESTVTGRRSPIHQVDYDFPTPRGRMDSDGDGVPDFVELAKGVDPRLGRDTDEDGFSDLEEIVAGTNPNLASSKPDEERRLGGDSHFDLYAKPLGHEGGLTGDATLTACPRFVSTGVEGEHPATTVRVFDAQSRLMRAGFTSNNEERPSFIPSAAFLDLPVTVRDSFFIVATGATWQADRGQADEELTVPESIALVPMPLIEPLQVQWNYSSGLGNVGNANAWVAAYQAALSARMKPVSELTMDYRDALELLVVERVLGLSAFLRGVTSSANLSLTGFRDPFPPAPAGTLGWAGNFSLTEEQLASLAQPHPSGRVAILPSALLEMVRQHLRASGTEAALAFTKLGREFHRAYVDNNADNLGVFGNPFDHLRTIVQGLPFDEGGLDGVIPLPGDSDGSGYAGKIGLTTLEMAAAERIMSEILQLELGRPTEVYEAEVYFDTYREQVPRLLVMNTGDEVRLRRVDGSGFPLNAGAELMEGSVIRVTAFTDRYVFPDLEVISAQLVSVPGVSAFDNNGDLMDDELSDFWFFGQNSGPFDDDDGDGYANYQELLEGTSPREFDSRPMVAALPRRVPNVRIFPVASDRLRLEFDFPDLYSDRIGFELEYSESLASFDASGDEAVPVSPQTHALDVELYPEFKREFYRFKMHLRGTGTPE